jgi:hypothetical protein
MAFAWTRRDSGTRRPDTGFPERRRLARRWLASDLSIAELEEFASLLRQAEEIGSR